MAFHHDTIRDPNRLEHVRQLILTDATGRAAFTRLARLAARFLDVPTALVTLVDQHRLVILGQTGLAEPWATRGEMPLELSYCRYALRSTEPLLISDARRDGRGEHDRAIGEAGAVAYAGVPLVVESRYVLGTLCVTDRRPRRWTEEEVDVLCALASSAMTEIELRRDAAGRRRAEAVLRQQADLLDLAHDGIFVRSLDGTISYWNRGAERAYGWTAQEALSRRSHDLLATRFPRPLEEIERELIETGQWEGDLVHFRRSGDRAIDASRWVLQRDERGAPVGVLEINRDITRRRSAEDALRTAHDRLEQQVRQRTGELRLSEQRFRALIEHSTEIIGILAADGICRYMSPAVKHVLGFAPEEVIGHDIFRAVHPADLTGALAAFGRAQEEGVPVSVEFRCRRRDGAWRRLRATWVSLLEERAVGGVVVNARDVTDLRQGEERLRQAQKMEAVGRLAAGIAHDFNNVLMVIKGYSGMALLDLPADHPLREDLEQVDDAAERAANLTRQLLTFSRQQVLQPQVLDLNSLVASMEKMLRRTLGEDIDFVTALGPDLARVEADPGQMEQILMNLAINARDAMPSGGTLIMETRNVDLSEQFEGPLDDIVHPGPYVMLAVSDTGTGMPKDVRERIFDPFFTTKAPGKGTGLGLSTVYGIVKQSGGYVWVYSEEGRGTTFKLYLPRASREAPLHAEQRPAQRENQPRATILLVEDEAAVRAVARRILQRSGHTVLEAASGEDALRIAEEHGGAVDLLITDVVMPRIGGRELAARITERWPHIPVLYTSGYTDEAVVHHGVLAGSAAFLQKPYQPAALTDRVAEMLGAAGDGG